MKTPLAFGTRHLSAIGFVIEANEMKQAVQHQDANLIHQRVAKLTGLHFGALNRDREVADRFFAIGWERKDIGCVVVVTKLPVEPLEGAVVRDETGKGAAGCDGERQGMSKLGERSLGLFVELQLNR